MNKTHILIRLLQMYIPRNWEFGSDVAKLRNFGGEFKHPPPPAVCHCATEKTLVLVQKAYRFWDRQELVEDERGGRPKTSQSELNTAAVAGLVKNGH
jgi:hypothetical protein